MYPKITAAESANFLKISLHSVHRILKNQQLPSEKNQNRVYFSYETAKKIFNIPFDKKIIAFQIVKGGTGKTSLAQAFAIRSNLYGARVLCIDLDQQGNLTQSFNVNAEDLPVMVDVLKGGVPIEETIVNIIPGLDLIPSRIENAVIDNVIMLERMSLEHVYKKRFQKLLQEYDLIVIDCPPALGQSVAAVALTSDCIIAPVTPEEFSLSGLKITYEELLNLENNYQVTIPLRLVLNKFDARTSLSHDVLSTLLKHKVYGSLLLRSYVRSCQEFPNSINKGESIFDTLKLTPAKEDIDLFTREVLNISRFSDPSIPLGRLEEHVEIA
jgi:chromosome partitioning protein